MLRGAGTTGSNLGGLDAGQHFLRLERSIACVLQAIFEDWKHIFQARRLLQMLLYEVFEG